MVRMKLFERCPLRAGMEKGNAGLKKTAICKKKCDISASTVKCSRTCQGLRKRIEEDGADECQIRKYEIDEYEVLRPQDQPSAIGRRGVIDPRGLIGVAVGEAGFEHGREHENRQVEQQGLAKPGSALTNGSLSDPSRNP